MAIVGTDNNDDDELKQGQIAASTTSSSPNAHAAYDAAQGKPYQGAGGDSGFVGGSGTGSGQGATTGVGAATTGAASPNPGGSGYSNLSQYLAANQGTGATTGQAAENVVNQADNVRSGAQNAFEIGASDQISGARNAVNQDPTMINQINSGAATVDPTMMNKISSGAYSYQAPSYMSDLSKASDDDLKAAVGASQTAPISSTSTGLGLAGLTTGVSSLDVPIIDPSAMTTAANKTPQYSGPISNITASTGALPVNSDISVPTNVGSSSNYTGPTDFSDIKYTGPSQAVVAYSGPRTTSDFTGDAASNQTATLGALSNLAQNVNAANGGQSGVSGLLQTAYRQPNYSAGENTLDAFLANGTEGGKQALGQATGVGQNANNSYQALLSKLSGQEKGGEDVADSTNTAYANAIKGAQNKTADTVNSYQDAVKNAQAAGYSAADQQRADADKITAELAKRTQAQIDDEKKKNASPTAAGDIANTAKKAAGDATQTAKDYVNPVVSDVENLPKNIATEPLQVGNDAYQTLGDFAQGDLYNGMGGVRNLAPTFATGGLNKLAPSTINAASGAVKTAGGQIANIAKSTAGQATNTAKSVAHKLGFAHGGQVPSYGNLVSKLRGKK